MRHGKTVNFRSLVPIYHGRNSLIRNSAGRNTIIGNKGDILSPCVIGKCSQKTLVEKILNPLCPKEETGWRH
jgi:hypothetical protein